MIILFFWVTITMFLTSYLDFQHRTFFLKIQMYKYKFRIEEEYIIRVYKSVNN